MMLPGMVMSLVKRTKKLVDEIQGGAEFSLFHLVLLKPRYETYSDFQLSVESNLRLLWFCTNMRHSLSQSEIMYRFGPP